MTTKRIEAEDLPNGGSYAILQYIDADGTPISEGQAVRVIVTEYSKTDKPIALYLMEVESNGDN